MTTKKRFGGLDLGQIAAASGATAKAVDVQPTASRVPIGDLVLHGAPVEQRDRANVPILVDPKRCRPWKFHDRHPSWYTVDKCQDLITALTHQEQQEPALGRRLEGDPDFDYELIYGMRRRFACEFLGKKLKLRVKDIDDKQASVLQHQENHDRQDITAMERAISYLRYLRENLFNSQDEIAAALSVKKGTVSKMVLGAQLLENPTISAVLPPNPTQIPLTAAYEVSAALNDETLRDIVLRAAANLKQTKRYESMSAPAVLKYLKTAPERSEKVTVQPIGRKPYNVGSRGRMLLTRNEKGKVTLAFPDGVTKDMEDEVIATIRLALKDL